MKKVSPAGGFVAGVIAAVVGAFLMPEPGATGGLFRSEITSNGCVFLIFLLQGMGLPTEDLGKDLRDWRLHLFVQCFNFVAVPALALLLGIFFGSGLSPDLRAGFIYLSFLPTTILMAVVFSSMANGNVAGAIFNTSLSNLLAVFIVPAVMIGVLSASAELTIPLTPMLLKITMLLLLPLILGQLLRPWLRPLIQQSKRVIGYMKNGLIFFIIYATFCNSVQRGTWQDHGWETFGAAFCLSFALLVLVKATAWSGLLLLKFPYPSRMTAFFCASQKSLATGVPMATFIFASGGNPPGGYMPELGIVLLPVMCYHAQQLVLGSFILSRCAKETSGD